MSSATTLSLFQPIQVGDVKLNHRVVLAPQTRFRANKDQVPGDISVEYYKQRASASVPGTLLITEAAYVSAFANNAPKIYTDEQVAAWRKITDAVHAPDSIMNPSDDIPYVAPSPIPIPESGGKVPKEMTKEASAIAVADVLHLEIKQYIEWYANAAVNAIHRAGFDGVEVHAANGFLINQFLEDTTNKRAEP
ncbi:hypothetical protein LXA43DRAFT_1057409 [Ganoderma leucocontextum]|nr:hypothetical protein LXA43DRAFT_1057409 [Ganoderma leucocontextum]